MREGGAAKRQGAHWGRARGRDAWAGGFPQDWGGGGRRQTLDGYSKAVCNLFRDEAESLTAP